MFDNPFILLRIHLPVIVAPIVGTLLVYSHTYNRKENAWVATLLLSVEEA
jgi:hypothetical protein